MAYADPQRAVIEHLVAPAGKQIDVGVARPGGPGGPVPSVYSGKPYEARPDSIEFRKERGLENRRLFAVAFDDLSDNRWSYLVAAEHDGDGWVAHGVAGGSDGPPMTNRRPPRPAPVSARPSIHIYGQWGADRLYAGGELDPGTGSVGSVRLTLADGMQITDDGERGVVLFVGRTGGTPATVDIFDDHGDLCASRAF
jgi:hypothetical protein